MIHNFAQSPLTFVLRSTRRFRKILWPSQNEPSTMYQIDLFGVVIASVIYHAHGMQQPITEANPDLNLVKDFNGSFH